MLLLTSFCEIKEITSKEDRFMYHLQFILVITEH